jgi:hypothetical protein
MSKNGGTPWPVWAAVTVLVAVIGTFGKLLVDRAGTHSGTSGGSGLPQPLDTGSRTPLAGSEARSTLPERRTDWGSLLGLYTGESVNRVSYNRGVTVLDIKSVDPSGRMRAEVEWSRGLYGSGTLYGTASDTSAELSGTILSETTGIWDCDFRFVLVSRDSIHGTYRLYPRAGNPHGTQDGEFGLARIR